MVLLRFLRDDVRNVGIVRVECEAEAELRRQAVAVEPLPVVAAIIGPVDAAVVLLPQPVGFRGMRRAACGRTGRPPGTSPAWKSAATSLLIGVQLSPRRRCETRRLRRSRCTSSRYVELNRVAAHAAGAGLPPLPRVGCSSRPRFTSHVSPPSSERKSTPGSPPSQSSEPLARLDVPRGVELEPGLLRQPDLLGARPRSCRDRWSGGQSRRRTGCSSPRRACRPADRRSRGRRPSPAGAGPRPPSRRSRSGRGRGPCAFPRVEERPSGKTLPGRVVEGQNNGR